MDTDISVREGAENGIDKGVQDHVRVGMTREAMVVWNAYSCEHHVVAIAELSDGSLWSDAVEVIVTIAACLEYN